MSLVSVEFILFMMCSFLGYFLLPRRTRPYFLLAVGLFFYGCFQVRAFIYIGFTAVSSFLIGIWMPERKPSVQKLLMLLSLVCNLGILILVKYLDYVLGLFASLMEREGTAISLLVPLGVAFYTMQAVSYTVDVYRGRYAPERNFCKYLLYMTYFPIIMQGPISRYDQLADQVFTPHDFSFDRMKAGLSLALFGFFKKMVIADRAALLVDQVFNSYASHNGVELAIAAILYTIQIYTDFSGCVDICRGVSQVFGIELIDNFKHPYFSSSIKDFWRKWHCSLSSWFRDYIYIPLGGSRKGSVRKYVNLTVVFLVSGLWHGVGLQFIAWGLLHAVYQIIGETTAGMRRRLYKRCGISAEGRLFKFGQQLITFGLLVISWIFFRAPSLTSALQILKAMVTNSGITAFLRGPFPNLGLDKKDWIVLLISVCILWIISMLQKRGSVRDRIQKQNFVLRYMIYLVGIFTILIFGIYGPGYSAAQFIYMQF